MKYLVILLFAGSMTAVSCMSHRHKNDDRLCTTEYRMLTISIKDINAKPVLLSDYFARKTTTGEIIDFAKESPYIDSINRLQGIYFICTDGMMGMTSLQGTEFEFHGILDSTEIVNETYIIANDECHVYMLAGNPEIILTR